MFLNVERILKILVAIVIIGVAGYFGYSHFTRWQDRKVEAALVKEKKIKTAPFKKCNDCHGKKS